MALIWSISRDLAPTGAAISLGLNPGWVYWEEEWCGHQAVLPEVQGEERVLFLLCGEWLTSSRFSTSERRNLPREKCTLCLWELREAAGEENWVLWMWEQWCGAAFPGILHLQTLSTFLCFSFTAFGASSASHFLDVSSVSHCFGCCGRNHRRMQP